MYHSSGGMIGTGVSWYTFNRFLVTIVALALRFAKRVARCPLIVRKKFSAKGFWTDIRKYDVTVMQVRLVLVLPLRLP